MSDFIIGTAGHIDHGKTALIKALTGIDCDTHPQEKQRGITINLGFSHLDFPTGKSIGIVDVPGHQDFVNTMVAGAHGIDLIMLVIAADSGVMPQTVEHIRIAESLGIKNGFVALTKTDLADDESLSIAEADVKDFLKNTFLDGCEIIKASAKTGEGLDQIKKHLDKLAVSLEARPSFKTFRMYIDRIFSVQGFGTVVTGSVIGGSVKKDDHLFLLPTGKELRVRRMERHGQEVDEINAGNRVSMNLVGLNKDDFKRGMLLSDKISRTTKMIDAKLELFPGNKKIRVWSDVVFLTGTYCDQVKMHLINKNELVEGQSAIVQIHFSQPCTIFRKDKFIIRSTSGDKTLGGGEVIDPFPLHHRRRTQKLIEQLTSAAAGGFAEFIVTEVRKRRVPLSLSEMSSYPELGGQKSADEILNTLPEDIIKIKTESDTILMLLEQKEKIVKEILQNLASYHKRNPMIETGKTLDELIHIAEKNSVKCVDPVVESFIDELVEENKLKEVGITWSLADHKVQISRSALEKINFVEDFHKKSGMHIPLMSDLISAAQKKGIDEKKLHQVLDLLVAKGSLHRIEDSFVHSSIVDFCRDKLLISLKSNSNGITVAGFRDLVKGNRKICLLLLNHFDTEGITIRGGDFRKITEKGKALLDGKK